VTRHAAAAPVVAVDEEREEHMQTATHNRMRNAAVMIPEAMPPILNLLEAAKSGGVPESFC